MTTLLLLGVCGVWGPLLAVQQISPVKHRVHQRIQDGDKVNVLNRARIYHPSVFDETKLYKKIGLVSSRTILDATPEYKQIKARGLDPESAEYGILVKRASDRFKRLLRMTASQGGYDLIAEVGAISVSGKVLPEITQEVLNHLK